MYEFKSFNDHGSSLAPYIKGAMNVILLLVSGLATFSFFFRYSGSLLDTLLPAALSSLFAGLIGVTLLEGSVLVWHYLSVSHADTKKQISISKTGYVVSLALSVAVTVIYFALSSDLLSGYMTSDLLNTISFVALLLIVGSVSFQFVSMREYDRAGSATQQAKHQASLKAESNRARHLIEQQTTAANLEKSVNAIQQQIHATSDNHARVAVTDFLASQNHQERENARG